MPLIGESTVPVKIIASELYNFNIDYKKNEFIIEKFHSELVELLP